MIILVILIAIVIFAIIFWDEPKKEVKTNNVNLSSYGFSKEYIFYVAGVHESRFIISNFCNLHDIITLVPEPNNKYDTDAIKVMHGESSIGYVPAGETNEVSKILKFNHIAYIHEIEKDSWIDVKIRIKY